MTGNLWAGWPRTVRWTFALDVEDTVDDPARDYWEKFLSVTEAHVEERVTPPVVLHASVILRSAASGEHASPK